MNLSTLTIHIIPPNPAPMNLMDQTTTAHYVARLARHGAIESAAELGTRMIQSSHRLKELKALVQQTVISQDQTTINNAVKLVNQQMEEHRGFETLLARIGAIGEFVYFGILPLVSEARMEDCFTSTMSSVEYS
jgi:hypothetical protein